MIHEIIDAMENEDDSDDSDDSEIEDLWNDLEEKKGEGGWTNSELQDFEDMYYNVDK